MPPLKIEVNGEGETARAPDLGVVNVRVEDKGENQTQVIAAVQQTAAAVQAQIAPLATSTPDAAIVRWSSDGMSTRRYDEYSHDPVTGRSQKSGVVFEATVHLKATFRDFQRLSAWTRDLGAVPLVTVSSVEWTLLPATTSALRADVLRQAFEDAREKAAAYAAAAGRPALIPVEVREGGMQNRPYAAGGRMMAMADMSGGGGGQEVTLDYRPEDVKYSATCSVVFHAE